MRLGAFLGMRGMHNNLVVRVHSKGMHWQVFAFELLLAVVCADMQWHGVAEVGVFPVAFSLNYPFRELSRVIFCA